MEMLLALLLAIFLFALVTFAISFAFDLGIELAFQIEPNLYGIWILVVASVLFCLLFVKAQD